MNEAKVIAKVMMRSTSMNVRMTFEEELLGTANANKNIHDDFVAEKAPDAQSRAEEVASLGVEAVVEKSKTIFSRDDDGNPILWDYQIKGFFKDACGMLNRAVGTMSSQLTAYRKVIDGLVFVMPRKIVLNLPPGGEIGECQRPIRMITAQGERVALAHSETVPAGTCCDFEILFYPLKKKKGKAGESPDLGECILEWLEYGALRGVGQWRNSGKGRYSFEVLD